MENLLADVYIVSVVCGGVGLIITGVGGWLLLKGLEAFKSDSEE